MLKKLFFIVALVECIISCRPGIPGRYLQTDEMVDILYDYHLAEGIIQGNGDTDTLAMRIFKASILRKHDVSVAEFDSSMVYYTRHTQLLEDVYTKLANRLDKESTAHGVAGSALGGLSIGSDTANVWNAAKAFVLSPNPVTNRYTFELKADSSYHAGDCLILDFNAQFLYQDGVRDASVVLAVTYANDSTEYTNAMLSSSSRYRLQLSDTERRGIKMVRGFWLLSSDNSLPTSSVTTLKLLIVSNISLVRMHTSKPQNEAEEDSVKVVKPDTASTPRQMPISATDGENGMEDVQGDIKPRPTRPLRPNLIR